MGTVKRLAEEVKRGLRETHPGLRETVVSNLALAVGAMIEGQTPTRWNWPTGCRWRRSVRTCASSGCDGC